MNYQEAVAAVLQDKVATRRAWLGRGDDDLCLRRQEGIVDICGWTQAGTRGVLTDADRAATDWLIVEDDAVAADGCAGPDSSQTVKGDG
jgi:hypothetical protein